MANYVYMVEYVDTRPFEYGEKQCHILFATRECAKKHCENIMERFDYITHAHPKRMEVVNF